MNCPAESLGCRPKIDASRVSEAHLVDLVTYFGRQLKKREYLAFRKRFRGSGLLFLGLERWHHIAAVAHELNVVIAQFFLAIVDCSSLTLGTPYWCKDCLRVLVAGSHCRARRCRCRVGKREVSLETMVVVLCRGEKD